MTRRPPATRRPLGRGEQLWWQVSQAGSANGTMVAALGGPVDPDRLVRALRQTVAQLPMLRVTVQSAPCPAFELMAEAPLPWRIVPRAHADHWRSLTEADLQNALPHDAAPLWRLTLVHGADASELLFTFHHATGDGLSGVLFFDTLLRCYSGPHAMGGRSSLPRAYDDLLGDVGALPMLRHWTRWLWGQVTRPRSVLLPGPAEPDDPGRPASTTRVLDITLEPTVVRRLLAQCKVHGESLNSLLSAALLLAARHTLDGEQALPLMLTSAINVRPLLTQPMHAEVGYYVTGIDGQYPVAPASDLWALSRAVGARTQAQFTREHVAHGLALRRLLLAVKRSGHALVDMIPQATRNSLHVTNLGRLNLPGRYGDLELRRCFHVAAVDLVRRPYICLAAVTLADALQLTFSYCAPQTPQVLVERVMHGMQHLLQRVAQDARPNSISLTNPGRKVA